MPMSATIASTLWAITVVISAAGTMILDNTTIQIVATAALTAVAPTIVALAAWRRSKKTDAKADVLLTKTDEIHDLTNSNLTKVTNDLAEARKEIVDLTKEAAADLAGTKGEINGLKKILTDFVKEQGKKTKH